MTEKMFLSPCHRKIKLKRSVHVNQVQNWLQRVRPKGEVTSRDFTWDYAMNSHLFAIPSTELYHPEDPPDECGALGVGIIFVSWNDFSWFNGASALNAKNWADIKIFQIGRELICDSLQECPHPSRFRCWHLTTLCWDYVSGINSWKWDLCSFLHATNRILWLVMVFSAKTTDNLSRVSRPLTLSFSIMACLTRHASDWSSDRV